MGEVLLSQPDVVASPLVGGPGGVDAASERAARRALRRQIARLDAEIGEAVLRSFSARGHGEGSRPAVAVPGDGPRILDLGELEIVRDELAGRLRAIHDANDARTARQRTRRAELEQMLLAPGHHRFKTISCEELGEPGCGVYRVRPRLGLIGMLAGWWQVKLSSGCPLPGRP